MLLHGGNYFARAWEGTIDALRNAGFRVVAVDQIGYGRSSKPIIPYSLDMHAANTKRVLDHLGIERAAIVGHSMGGMIATRFAFPYPDTTTHMVMVNPIGLSPPQPGRAWTEPRPELGRSFPEALKTIRGHVHEWKDEYMEYVRIHHGWTLSGEWPRLARIRALNSQVMQTPILHDWPHIQAPSLRIAIPIDSVTCSPGDQRDHCALYLVTRFLSEVVMRWVACSTLIVGLLAAGCAPAPAERTAAAPDRAADEKALRDLDARWLKAAEARDAATEAALFASDGVAYRQNVEPLVGPGAIEAHFKKEYAEHPHSRVIWTTDTLRIAEAGDIAVQTGEVRVSGLGSKGDGEDRTRFLTAWKKVNGEWNGVRRVIQRLAAVRDTLIVRRRDASAAG